MAEAEAEQVGGSQRHFCTFCKVFQTKLPRHLERKHGNEEDVQKALSYPKKSKERRDVWTMLQRKGDYETNLEAINESKGLKPVRKSKCADADYLPCCFCFGLFLAKKLSSHTSKCFMRDSSQYLPASVVKSSRAMFFGDSNIGSNNQKVFFSLLNTMKHDEVHLIIRTDNYLIKFAKFELERKENERYADIRYSLKVITRLLMKYREVSNSEASDAQELVMPANYDVVVQCMKEQAVYENSRTIGNPHLVWKIGYSLRTLVIIVKVENLKLGFLDVVEQIRCFEELYESDYCILSNNAKAVYEKRKANVPEELPEEEDIKTLRNFCIAEIKQVCSSAGENVLSHEEYMYMSKLVYVRLLTFNARRGGEPGKLLLEDWKMIESDRWKRESDIDRITDPVEKQLMQRLKLCYIEGKKKKRGEYWH